LSKKVIFTFYGTFGTLPNFSSKVKTMPQPVMTPSKTISLRFFFAKVNSLRGISLFMALLGLDQIFVGIVKIMP